MPIPIINGEFYGQKAADSTGAATITLGPVRQGFIIRPTAIAVNVIGSNNQATATWYKNAATPQNFGSKTFTGTTGDTDNAPGVMLYGGEQIVVVFAGAASGDICYARCNYDILQSL